MWIIFAFVYVDRERGLMIGQGEGFDSVEQREDLKEKSRGVLMYKVCVYVFYYYYTVLYYFAQKMCCVWYKFEQEQDTFWLNNTLQA